MIISNCKFGLAVGFALTLYALPAAAQPAMFSQHGIPGVEEAPVEEAKKAPEPPPPPPRPLTKTEAAIAAIQSPNRKPAKVDMDRVRHMGLGNIAIRSVPLKLEEISLWREEDEKYASDMNVWNGATPEDVARIMPSLIGNKNEQVKKIALRIAMSAGFSPGNMDDMDYIRWRAAVLAADKKYTDAARLLNTARIGRDSNADLLPRIAFELASGQAESACMEAMAGGHVNDTPFWQGMQILCAHQMGDMTAVENLRGTLPDSDMKTAAMALSKNSGDAVLIASLITASGVLPTYQPLADNKDILRGLKRLLSDIKESEDSKAEARRNQGELLLLSLGALSAEERGDDTQKLTDEALHLAGF